MKIYFISKGIFKLISEQEPCNQDMRSPVKIVIMFNKGNVNRNTVNGLAKGFLELSVNTNASGTALSKFGRWIYRVTESNKTLVTENGLSCGYMAVTIDKANSIGSCCSVTIC